MIGINPNGRNLKSSHHNRHHSACSLVDRPTQLICISDFLQGLVLRPRVQCGAGEKGRQAVKEMHHQRNAALLLFMLNRRMERNILTINLSSNESGKTDLMKLNVWPRLLFEGPLSLLTSSFLPSSVCVF